MNHTVSKSTLNIFNSCAYSCRGKVKKSKVGNQGKKNRIEIICDENIRPLKPSFGPMIGGELIPGLMGILKPFL